MSAEPKTGELGRVTQLSAAVDAFDRVEQADVWLALDFEEQKRLREDAFRRAAYALVEAELRELSAYVDVRLRRSRVTVEAVETATAPSLIDAVDAVDAKERR